MSKKNLIKNIASLSVVQIANYVLPLISIPVISRVIGPDKFGVINYAVAFIAYFNILITYGFDLTATRKVAQDPENIALRNKVFSEVFQAKTLLFIISCLIFTICLNFVPPLKVEARVAIFSFLFCIGTLFTQNWLFLAMQDIPKVALFDFMSKLLFTVAVLLVVQHKEDYVWQPLITSLIQIVVAITSFTWAIKRYKLKMRWVGLDNIFALLKSESVVFFSFILINLYTTTNVIVLGLFQTPENVGYYTGGQKLIIVAYSVISLPLSHALFPYIGRAFAESREHGLLLVQKIIPLVFVLTGTLALGMFIFGPWALRLFYGPEFEPSVFVFQLLVFAPMFIAMGSIFGVQIMLNLKMDKLFFRITLTAAAISICVNFLLVKQFGYVGTALNWLITEIFIATTMYIFLRKAGLNPINLKWFHPRSFKEQLDPLLARFKGRKLFLSKE
ncbi:flippase [Dyadobacter luticola]|uniref:Flippase n=1 Tax=Dyadobacter luticola TaxID=1979387 RepID=A0A5R9L601_9BACT|nr:flippase [Dyadobacter luticola]TLV03710.1 flippase [Dyadobacter luticola]